jgi:hypothetical protein
MMAEDRMRRQIAVYIRNKDYEASHERNKIDVVLPDRAPEEPPSRRPS